MASGQLRCPCRPVPGSGHVQSFTVIFVFQPSAELNKAHIRILPVFQVNAYLGAFAPFHKGSEEDRLTSEYRLHHFLAGGACTGSSITLSLSFPFCKMGTLRNVAPHLLAALLRSERGAAIVRVSGTEARGEPGGGGPPSAAVGHSHASRQTALRRNDPDGKTGFRKTPATRSDTLAVTAARWGFRHRRKGPDKGRTFSKTRRRLVAALLKV